MLDKRNAALYRGERNAMKNVNLWPNGVVPYILDTSVGEKASVNVLTNSGPKPIFRKRKKKKRKNRYD